MSELDELADNFERKSSYWSAAFAIAKWLIAFNALLFALFIFTSVKGPFTLIYGTSPANVWFGVGVATVLTVILSTAYHRAHGYLELAGRARGRITELKPEDE
jgi:hypothetical protein